MAKRYLKAPDLFLSGMYRDMLWASRYCTTPIFGDGLLDVCIYKCASRLHLLKHSLVTVLKQHAYSADVIYRQGKDITVSSQVADMKTEIDGDPGPALPMRIKVIPDAVNCIVPENARPAGIRTRIIRALG